MPNKLDPVTLRAYREEIETLTEFFEDLGRKGPEAFEAIMKIARENLALFGENRDITGQVTDKLKEMGIEGKKFVEYLDQSSKSGAKLDQQMREVHSTFKSVSSAAGDFSKLLREIESGMTLFGGTSANVMFDLGEGVFKIGKSIAMIAKDPLGGVTGIVNGLVEVGKALDAMDKYWAGMNRSVYDTNAALGKMGEYSESLVVLASHLGNEYVRNIQEVEKMLGSLAKIGVSEENLARVADGVLETHTKWSELTPEKQIKMMSDFMKEFGMNSLNAQNVVKGLYMTAAALKNSVNELDISQFIEQVTRVAIASRRLNIEFEDTKGHIATVMKHLGEAPDALQRAAEFSQSMLSYGQQNIAMQVYMMEQYAKVSGGPFEAAGAWVAGGQPRIEAQTRMVTDMLSLVLGKDIEKAKPQELMGAMQITGLTSQLFPRLDEVTIKKISEEGGKGFADLMKDLAKEETRRADLQKELPGNVKKIVDKTTAITDHAKIWTETEFFRKGAKTMEAYAKEVGAEIEKTTGRRATAADLIGRSFPSDIAEKVAKDIADTPVHTLTGQRGFGYAAVTYEGTKQEVEQRKIDEAFQAKYQKKAESIQGPPSFGGTQYGQLSTGKVQLELKLKHIPSSEGNVVDTPADESVSSKWDMFTQ